MEGGGAAAKVKSIFVYPIKSCRGISVPQAPISPTGFRWDRQWLVVNSKGRAYTQRVEPKLALVRIELPSEAFNEDYVPNNNAYLVINSPGMSALKVPLAKPARKVDDVSVWEWSGSAVDEGSAAADWFSSYLGKPSRLVRFDDVPILRVQHRRYGTSNVDPDFARGYKIMFSDGYPYLLASQGSIDDLNTRLREPVSINRFRPNILVDGCKPFSEDLWTEIRINKFTFQGVKLCSRCKVPTINQETAVAEPEPNQTLMSFRSDKVLRPNKKPKQQVYFGQNLVCKDSSARGKGKMIKVGDPNLFVLNMDSSAAEAPA